MTTKLTQHHLTAELVNDEHGTVLAHGNRPTRQRAGGGMVEPRGIEMA